MLRLALVQESTISTCYEFIHFMDAADEQIAEIAP